MKRFRFRLERLERLRYVQRREAETRLAEALAGLADCDALIETRRRELGRAAASWSELPRRAPVDANALQLAADELDASRTAIDRAHAKRRIALERLRTIEVEHETRSREHRVLERLRARSFERWRLSGAREEQKLLDELHLLKLGRADSSMEVAPCADPSAGS
ncbi:MAG: hypothetical protein GY716_08575 [bacterium]|nr:hypothetical protein [bacterium]